MTTNNNKTEMPYAAWDLDAACSQGTIDEMTSIKELAWKGAV